MQPQSQNRNQTRRVNFFTQVDPAQIHETHENPCDTPPQAQSQNRPKNRKKFLVDSHFCENPSVTGLCQHPQKSIHNHG